MNPLDPNAFGGERRRPGPTGLPRFNRANCPRSLVGWVATRVDQGRLGVVRGSARGSWSRRSGSPRRRPNGRSTPRRDSRRARTTATH